MNQIKSLPVENLRCLRDPDCKKHPYHAGHLSSIGPIDPRVLYKTKQRRSNAGRRANIVVREFERYSLGPRMINSSQRRFLIKGIQLALLGTIDFPIT